MIDDEKVIKLINDAEFLLEGLAKNFWRLIKLSPIEIWETPEDFESEYVWVVAIIGNRCVFYDELSEGFAISDYDSHGELSENSLVKNIQQLNDLAENIVSSRFVIS